MDEKAGKGPGRDERAAGSVRRAGRAVKPLEELTIMDDYMFAAVMGEEANLRPLLELVLDVEVRQLRFVEAQRTGKAAYRSRGVRLDLYVEDAEGDAYNVEVQATDRRNLPRRMRYYQSEMDVGLLAPGADYAALPRSVVIFICGYDPFGLGRRLYTFESRCVQDGDLALGDGSLKVVAVARAGAGGGGDDAGEGLRRLLDYMGGAAPSDDYTRRLDEAVRRVKASEERRHEYMVGKIHDMEMRAEGFEEGMGLGIEEGVFRSIRNVMDSLGCGADRAMDVLQVPAPERDRYVELLAAE